MIYEYLLKRFCEVFVVFVVVVGKIIKRICIIVVVYALYYGASGTNNFFLNKITAHHKLVPGVVTYLNILD